MNTRILIAVVVSIFLCQQVHAQTEEEPEQAEATELEGTWETVSSVTDGEQHDTANGDLRRFEGNRWYYRGAEDKNWRPAGTFSMNPSAMPAEIDFVSRQGCYEFATYQLGIYELDGDLLRICMTYSTYSETPGTRPDRFESTEETWLIVFRRVTEEESE